MGKARVFSDSARESVYQKEFDDELYNTASQQGSYNLGSVHFSDQSGIANISQGGADQRKANLKGALFTGNIGFSLQTAKLDVATKTINLNNDSAGVALSVISTDRFVTLSTGTTSDLVTITGAQRPGQTLRLYNTLTNTITIKHTAAATVNTIRTPDTNDLTFPGNAVMVFVFDITTAQWRVVGNVGGTGTGTTLPVVDTTSIVKGSVDATKLLRFEVDGFTAGATRVLTPPDADASLAGLELTQTFTGANTFTGLTKVRSGSFRIQQDADITKELIFSLSTATTGKAVAIISAHTDDRFITLPDLTTTLAGLAVTQTFTGANTFTGLTKVRSGSFRIQQDADITKELIFSLSTATTGKAVAIISAHTDDRFITLPDLTTTLAGLAVTQTFTAVNTFSSTIVAGGVSNGMSNIGILTFINNTATPAGNGIFFFDGTDLKAKTGSTTVNLTNIGGANFTDAVFRVTDESDLTKKFALDVGSNTTGITATLKFAASSNITLTMPNATTTIPGLATVQTFTAVNTFSANIVAGGAGDGVTNLGHLDFINNLATPAATVSLYSDGTTLFSKSNLNMNSKDILSLGGETINSLTADASPVGATDFVMTYDASATALKKVLLSNLPSGAQTPWVSDIDADGFDLNDLSNLEFRLTASAPSSGINAIWADAGGINIQALASDDTIDFKLGTAIQLRIDEDGELLWVLDGHKIVPQATSFQILSSAQTDAIQLWTGTSRTNATIEVNDTTTTWLTGTGDTTAVLIQLIQNNNTPVDSRTLANIDFMAENSVSVNQIYGRISVSSQDVTDATEDGLMQLGVMSAGTVVSAMDMEGGTSSSDGAKISFYGQTPVARQTLSATPTNTEISTVLRNLGLTKL